MNPRLLTIISALSLLLCVAVCVLWVRSYFVADRLFWQGFEDVEDRSYWRQDVVRVGRGGIGMNHIVQSQPRNPQSGAEGFASWRSRSVPFHGTFPPEYPDFKFSRDDVPRWGGFKYGAFAHPDADARKTRPRAYGWQVVVPLWAVLLLVGPPTLLMVRRYVILARRRRVGLCPACGYDLRATPDRCPECGKVPPRTLAGADAGDGAGGHVSQTETSGRSPWQRRTPYRGS